MLKLGFEGSTLALLGGFLYVLFFQAALQAGPDQLARAFVIGLWLLPLLLFADFVFGYAVFLPIHQLLGTMDQKDENTGAECRELWGRLRKLPLQTVYISAALWLFGTAVLAWWMVDAKEVTTNEAALVFPCCALIGVTTSIAYFFRARFIIRPVLRSLAGFLPEDFAPPRAASIRRKMLVAFIFTVASVAVTFSVLAWQWKERGRTDAALSSAGRRVEMIAEGISAGGEIPGFSSEDYLGFVLKPFIVNYKGDPVSGRSNLGPADLDVLKTNRRFLGYDQWRASEPGHAALTGFFDNLSPLPEYARLSAEGEAGPETSLSRPDRWLVFHRSPLRGGLHPGVVVEIKQYAGKGSGAGGTAGKLLFVYFVMIFLVALLYAEWLAGDVTEPVENLREAMDKVSRGADPERVAVETDDEIGDLAVSFNRMNAILSAGVVEMRRVLGSVREAVASLTDTINRMASVSSDQASGASEQAVSLHQISSTSEEIAATLRVIAENAQSVEEVAGRTLASSHDGQQNLQDVSSGMEKAKARSMDLAVKMVTFQEQANRIEGVLDFIRDISDKINMIALNASIEASAVGEIGERFSIVASQMRDLAEQTAGGTREIQKIVTELQKATSSAIMATEEGEKQVTAARNLVDKASESFQSIVHWASETARSAQEIALSSNQQTTATDHLAGAMGEVREVAGKFAEAAKSLEESVVNLEAIGDRLKVLLDQQQSQSKAVTEGEENDK